MKLTVKARIALVMTIVVACNVVAGGISWVLYRSAADSAAKARVAGERARLATAASEGVTAFLASATDLALGVSSSTASGERSRSYGDLIGVDPVVDRAIRLVVDATPGGEGAAVEQSWQALRVLVYAWINAEARAGGADLRITRNPSGAFRNSVSTNLVLPSELAALPPADLRHSVRDRAERFKYSTLGDIVKVAIADSAAAAAAESIARARAQQGTVVLAALSALIAAALAIWLYRSISRPLSAAKEYADRVAGGEYGSVPPRHSLDEIGVLTHAVENMKDMLVHEMSVMREMAGAVLFTAEGVQNSLGATVEVVDGPEHDADSVMTGLADVGRQVDVLRSLSRQMLGM